MLSNELSDLLGNGVLLDPFMAIKHALRNIGDWGRWRIRLHPKRGTKSYGRDNFFLHGGSKPGSAGCIDFGGGVLGNSITQRLKNRILNDKDGYIEVIVY